MRQSIIDDEFWTPKDLYDKLCGLYNIQPTLDAAANSQNTKCDMFLTNALFQEWGEYHQVWCNPPHSKTLEFIERAENQHKKYGIRIIMIVPANVISTKIWHRYIENKREYHAVEGRPKFLKHGKPSKFPSRNSYIVILWGENESPK